MPIVYKVVSTFRAISTNTADTISLNLGDYRGAASLISATINVEGVLQAGTNAVKYILAIRNPSVLALAADTVIPLMSGWVRRGGWLPGSNATTVTVDEGGDRWEGFEPIMDMNPAPTLELYCIQLTGATITIRLRGILQVEVP